MTIFQERLVLGSLEKALQNRDPPSKETLPSSWEREAGRGVLFDFGTYRLPITNSKGGLDQIEIHEECSSISTRVWDCSVVTLKWIEHISLTKTNHRNLPDLANGLELPILRSRQQRPIQVLELGAGTGLLSVGLGKLGAAVLSTEYGISVKQLEENCKQNSVTSSSSSSSQPRMKYGEVTCCELDWYNPIETLPTLFSSEDEAMFDLIVATDCSMTTNDSRGVVDMIHKYGTKGHTRAIIGLCKEREGTSYCIDKIEKDFFNVVRIPQSELHPNFQSQRHTILKFQV
jgi:hypothetical protein